MPIGKKQPGKNQTHSKRLSMTANRAEGNVLALLSEGLRVLRQAEEAEVELELRASLRLSPERIRALRRQLNEDFVPSSPQGKYSILSHLSTRRRTGTSGI